MSEFQKILMVSAGMIIAGCTLLDLHIYCTGTALAGIGVVGVLAAPMLVGDDNERGAK